MPLAESMLIEQLKPVWNVCLDGFGNHDPVKAATGRNGPRGTQCIQAVRGLTVSRSER